MRLVLFGTALVSAAHLKELEAAAAAAGHELVSAGESSVAALWAEARQKFPDLVAAMQKGIEDARSKTISGGEKAVSVAEDVIAIVPEALKELPNLKDFLVHGVTELFADGEEALKEAAASLLGRL